MKTIMSEVKVSLHKIISRLHTAEEKMVTSESSAMETIQKETEFLKKGKTQCFRHFFKHLTYITSFNLNEILGRHYDFPHFTQEHATEKISKVIIQIHIANLMSKPVLKHTFDGRGLQPYTQLKVNQSGRVRLKLETGVLDASFKFQS